LENLARCLPTYINYLVFNEHWRLCRRSQRPDSVRQPPKGCVGTGREAASFTKRCAP